MMKCMEDYNDRGARDYVGAWQGSWLSDESERTSFEAELRALARTISSLPAGRVLDVACGTGVVTRHLRGELTGLDLSEGMLEIARERVPRATCIRGDAFS